MPEVFDHTKTAELSIMREVPPQMPFLATLTDMPRRERVFEIVMSAARRCQLTTEQLVGELPVADPYLAEDVLSELTRLRSLGTIAVGANSIITAPGP